MKYLYLYCIILKNGTPAFLKPTVKFMFPLTGNRWKYVVNISFYLKLYNFQINVGIRSTSKLSKFVTHSINQIIISLINHKTNLLQLHSKFTNNCCHNNLIYWIIKVLQKFVAIFTFSLWHLFNIAKAQNCI